MSIDGARIAVAAVTGLVALWRLVVLLRSPHPSRGRAAVFVFFATAFTSNLFIVPSIAAVADSLASGLANLVVHLSLVGLFVVFALLFSTALPTDSSRRLALHIAVAVAAAVVLVVTWALNLSTGRPLHYPELSAGGPLAPQAFLLTTTIYFVYATIDSAALAAKAARVAARHRRRVPAAAFLTCAVGMVVCLVGGPLARAPATLRPWIDSGNVGVEDPLTHAAATVGLSIGITLVTLGLCVLALRTLAHKTGEWVRAKRRVLILLPLWHALVEVFPSIVLGVPTSWLREVVRVRHLPFHYRRRVVECRDGLWQLSPYVDAPRRALEHDEPRLAELAITDQAARVRRAIERVEESPKPASEPQILAAAPVGGDDDQALLSLASQFSGERSGGSPRRLARGRRRAVAHRRRPQLPLVRSGGPE